MPSSTHAPDVQAFIDLTRPCLGTAFNFALRLCGRPRPAEGICQEAWNRAFRSRDRFRGDIPLRAWLLHHIYDVWLDQERGEAHALQRGAAAPYQAGSDDHRTFLAALGHLSPELRAILIVHDVLGLPCAEAATICGASGSDVKLRLRCARTRMREQLSTCGVTLGEEKGSDRHGR